MLKKELINLLADKVTNKNLSEKEARNILSLPLVEIPEWGENDDTPWALYNKEYPGKEWTFGASEYVFLKAVYHLPKVGYYIAELTEIDKGADTYVIDILYYPTVDTQITTIGIKVAIDGTNVTSKNLKVFGDRAGNYKEEQIKDISFTVLKRFLVTMRIFTDYHESLDLYPVTVQSEKPRLNSGNLKRVEKRLEAVQYTAPRLIYLAKLPNSKTDTISTPTGIKQKTHQRPGHWRTLTHPRYAKHRKYGVKNGVRVPPYWVGDKETFHEGNVYRLVKKEELE